MNGPELTADEELQNDLELERVEKAVFEMVDESDRSLFINFMRTETELFLLFADWTEKQRRKLVDLQLRNGDVWAEVAKHKAAAVRELEQLHAVFDLMKTAPVDGTFPQPPAATEEMERKKMRQLTVTGAINQVNEEESYREILTALRRRKKVGAELAAQLRQIAQTITAGAQEQVHFAHIVAHLCRRWNVTRIPYEQQVFKGSNLNYPYRAELWVELLSIPSRYWGVELLEDTTRSLAPTLWEAADNAGYLPDFSSTNTSSSTRRGEDVTAPGGSGGGGSANGTGSTGATASGVATSTGAISTGSAASPGDRHWESGRESATEAEQGRGGEEPGEENAGFEQHTEFAVRPAALV
ncbi:hypothetical protein GNI_076600 [Gregarina niphandrodes]|uniref:Uncharacterized protein n=1 Tax=Gregarina niphandrodes TaxID=110365 RepID=A0A023B6T7_GRENI|nr:hypothetical protein GNI_076600 [Gregarina niphandrodes]EZG66745.1 hypothetical protein GNI_076600 [Gregarina niphandrodes]|eukprot:XP_011130504.1 hypothetical protein GNI_076600 [Gregarina niphandrodes]